MQVVSFKKFDNAGPVIVPQVLSYNKRPLKFSYLK
jgi:hypothetical protein